MDAQHSPIKMFPISCTSLVSLAALIAAPTVGRADIIYVSNHNNSTIESFDSITGQDFGVFATVGGPRGLALDSAGNLYVASWSAGNVSKYTPTGVGSLYANTPEAEPIAFDQAGNLFTGDLGGLNTISEITPGGTRTTFASGLSEPESLAFDKAGNLYVANFYGGDIIKYNSAGVGSIFASGLQQPFGLAFDSAGNLYESNYYGHNIEKFTPGGVGTVFATGLLSPTGLAFDSAGNLFVADEWAGNNGQVDEFTPGGVGHVFADIPYGGPMYIAIMSVPEPSAMALLSLGFLALLAKRCRLSIGNLT
jgi:sugar lactone lactonase YvrE